jgi:hypothetical protein
MLLLDFKQISSKAYDCFQTFFLQINKYYKRLKLKGKQNFEINEIKIIGLTHLWDIVLKSHSKEVFTKGSGFLSKIYKEFSPSSTESKTEEWKAARFKMRESLLSSCMEKIKESSYSHLQKPPSAESQDSQIISRSLDIVVKLLEDYEHISASHMEGGSYSNERRSSGIDYSSSVLVKINNQITGFGAGNKSCSLNVQLNITIGQLVNLIIDKMHIITPSSEIMMLYRGKIISNDFRKVLGACKFADGGSIFLNSVDPEFAKSDAARQAGGGDSVSFLFLFF